VAEAVIFMVLASVLAQRGNSLYWNFFREFVDDQRNIGAIAPSSFSLSQQMISNANISNASVVAEYGPGTGVFTSEILARIDCNTCFFAIENNAKMAACLKKRFPDVMLFQDSAENAPQILRRLGRSEIDCIVSGLPWASFGSDLQNRLLQSTVSVLREGGTFVSFMYLHSLLLPSGQRFKEKLDNQ